MADFSLADIAAIGGSKMGGVGAGALGAGAGFLGGLLFGGLFNGGWGYGNSNQATQEQVQSMFNYSNLLDQNRDLSTAIGSGIASAISATNQAKYDNINVAKDIQVALTGELGRLETASANILAKQNECCCNTLRAIDGVNYNNAINTAAINANVTAQMQGIKDILAQNKIESLQNQVANLQLQLATGNTVKYPTQTVYNVGPAPFFGPAPIGF